MGYTIDIRRREEGICGNRFFLQKCINQNFHNSITHKFQQIISNSSKSSTNSSKSIKRTKKSHQSMAEFTAIQRLMPIFTIDEMPLGFDPKYVIGAAVYGGGSCRGLRTADKRKITKLSSYNRNRTARSMKVFASTSGSKSKNMRGKDVDAVVDQEAIYDDLLGDPDYESDDLSCFRGLVLDISYRPINVVCWKRAICLEFMEKADVLEYYDQTVNSVNGSFYIPAVLRVPHLLQVVKRRKIISTLSRKNILARDKFSCQYCSSTTNLTIDHVLPISRGGEWEWENLVAACLSCNSKKGQKTPEEANMKLHKAPKAPKDYDIIAIPLTNTAIKMLQMRKGTPEEWLQYLGGPSP
ncbi:putative HNH nuclease [Helianthus annuus]|nr:putative HNH nuclease [Helianthus annuus]